MSPPAAPEPVLEPALEPAPALMIVFELKKPPNRSLEKRESRREERAVTGWSVNVVVVAAAFVVGANSDAAGCSARG